MNMIKKSKKNLIVGILCFSLVVLFTSVTVFSSSFSNEDNKTIEIVASISNQEQIFEQFTKDTGIEVKDLAMSSGEVLSRMKAEGSPMADVWFGGGIDSFIEAKNDGLLEHYMSSETVDIPEMFRDKDGYWTGIYQNISGFIVNNEILEEYNLDKPTSWADLADPQYKDEIIMADPSISGSAYNVVNPLLQSMGEDYGWEYFSALGDNIFYFGKRGNEPHQKAMQGEVAIGITYLNGAILQLEEEYPITAVFPEDGVPWAPAAMAIFKDADNMDEAQIFIDWVLSKEGQKFIRDLNQFIMPRKDVDMPESMSRLSSDQLLEGINFEAFGEERSAILEKWKEKVDR